MTENPFLKNTEGHIEDALNIYEIDQNDADSLIPESLKEWTKNNNLEIPTAIIFDDEKRGDYSITISSGDLEIMKVDLSKSKKKQTLFVGGYLDNKIIRGQHMNYAFYKQLEIFAKRKGFRIISGINHMDNISYFVQKLDRFPVYTLNDNTLKDLPGAECGKENIGYLDWVPTYYFLYNEDKEHFVNKDYLQNDSWKEHVKFVAFPQFDVDINQRRFF